MFWKFYSEGAMSGLGIGSFALLLFNMSVCEQITLVALNKRVTWATCSHQSVKKSGMSDLLVIQVNNSQKRMICSILQFFTTFPLFYAQEWMASVALYSVSLFLLPLLFTKEWPWGNHSRRSLQKRGHEWFTPLAHDKRVTGAIPFFHKQIPLSLTKKWAIRSKNQRANFNPRKNARLVAQSATCQLLTC